jgi:hypothetical protein
MEGTAGNQLHRLFLIGQRLYNERFTNEMFQALLMKLLNML